MNGLFSRMDIAEERISDLEHQSEGISEKEHRNRKAKREMSKKEVEV